MKSKITIFIIVLLSAVSVAHAQMAWDGLQFTQNYYGGTARFTAMGGAFTALGGDFSSLSVNPAGIGVYRGYEFMITPSVNYGVADAIYLKKNTKDAYTRFGLDNIGLTFSILDNEGNPEATVKRLTVGIGYNQLSQTSSRMSVTGQTSEHIMNPGGETWTLGSMSSAIAESVFGTPSSELDLAGDAPYFNTNNSWAAILAWKTRLIDNDPLGTEIEYIGATDDVNYLQMQGPIEQSHYKENKGYTGEYLISFGGNVADQFYFGMNVGIQNVWHSYYESYSEQAVNSSNFDTGFKSMTFESLSETRGSGCNIKLGVLWRPIAGLRWGAYFHSPTWLYLTNEYSARMSTHYDFPTDNFDESTPLNTYDYRINTPVKWGTGLAYVIGSSAIISVEYEGQDYSAIRMLDHNGNWYTKMPYSGGIGYHYEDDYIRRKFRLATNLRAGAEYRLNALSFRLGYAYYGSPVVDDNTFARSIFSAGLGFRTGVFYVDGAYAFSPNNEAAYTLYDSSPIADTDSYLGKISVTLGFRF